MKKALCGLFLIAVTSVLAGCFTGQVINREVTADGKMKYEGSTAEQLAEKNVISGYVLVDGAEKETPIKGAVVEIKNANLGMGYYKVTTDSKGFFKIEDFVPRIRYIVQVSAPGFISKTYSDEISYDRTFNIYLSKSAIVHGRITGTADENLAGVEVKLGGYSYDEGERNKPMFAVTDAKGEYSFDSVSEGSYLATFRKDGYITETAQINEIRAGESFTLPMRLFKKTSFSGTVNIRGVNAAAANVQVSVKGGRTHYTTTYQDGSFRIEDIKPGEYKLRFVHQGFHEQNEIPVVITEGKENGNLTYEITPKEAQVEVSASRYTFTPDDKIDFNIRTLRLEKIKMRVYRVPMNVLLRGKSNPDTLSPAKEKFIVVKEREDGIANFSPYEWRYQSLEMGESLAPGGYCIEVSGADKVYSRKFFTVTTVGLVVKRSRESVFAYVTDMSTNKPIPNAEIAVFDNTPEKEEHQKLNYPYEAPQRIEDLPIKIIQKGKADANGIYHKPLKNSLHLSVLAVGTDGSFAFCSTGSPLTFAQEETKFFIYTDRPVYRAGDKVHYKIIGKKRERGFSPISAETIRFQIRNRDMDSVLDSGDFTLDEWGTANGTFDIPADGNLGECEIRAGVEDDKMYSAGVFYIEQYRKPEFFINVTPVKSFYTNGENAEFRIEAKYFFGAPLKSAHVRYRIYERKLRDTDMTYWWEEDYQPENTYDKLRDEGDAFLDDNGVSLIRTSCGKFPYDREFTVEATVVDKSNISITSRESVRVGRGEFYIKINPSRNFYESGENKKIALRTLAQDGNPVRTGVSVKVYRYIWKPWERVYVHDKRPVAEYTVHSDEKGNAVFELPKKFDTFGEFDIVAEAKDRLDNQIVASQIVWIYSGISGKIESRFKNLEMSLSDKDLSGPGEITCLLKSRFQDAYVCITLEGKDVYESRVVKMTGNITPVKIPIKTEYAPNLYITATMQRSRALFTSTAGITLPDPDATLNISITPSKDKYLPGEKAEIKIRTTDTAGKPVKSDLSLGVVDEAIYSIRPDHTPKMKDFFYTKISNWVLTNYSYPISVLAGAAKEGKTKIREKFEDTAFWKADVRTNANGECTLSFTLPDNLTTWRLTARGHDKSGRVGEKKNTFLVTQDLIARIGKPRFFTEGDSVGLLGIVTSNTTRGLPSVKTEFKIDGTATKSDDKESMSLPPYGTTSQYYSMTVPSGKDKIAVQYTATADRDAKDSLINRLPVFPRGTPYSMSANGDMTVSPSVELKPITSTDDFDVAPGELVLSVNPNPIVLMIKACRYLNEYPYGCIEQTVNRYLPNLALKKLLAQKGYGDVTVVEDLDGKINLGTNRVNSMQNDDGTWGWFAGDRGNEFLTGYVMQAFLTAKENGYDVDTARMNRGVDAINRMLPRNSNISDDGRAFLLYTAARYKKWNHDTYEYLLKGKDMNAYRYAFIMRAIPAILKTDAIDAKQRAQLTAYLPVLTGKLKSLMQRDGTGVFWESPSPSWSWQGGRTEVTAHVLSALAESGDTTQVPSMIVQSLSRRSRGGNYQSTKEASQVILSFCSYLERQKSAPAKNGKSTVRFALDGKEVASFTYNQNDMTNTQSLVKKIPLDRNTRKNAFNLVASGDSDNDLTFDATLKGFLYYRDSGFSSLFKSENRSLTKLENGISLTRNFSSIRRVRDVDNNEFMVPQPITESTSLRVGDEILVKIKFQAHDDFEYIILEDYLPSGFEVVNKNVYDLYTPYVHQERWDDRMTFFFTKLRKGEVYELAYVIRAELPGEFIAKPTRAECMYEPSVQGWSLPVRFKVQKGKDRK